MVSQMGRQGRLGGTLVRAVRAACRALPSESRAGCRRARFRARAQSRSAKGGRRRGGERRLKDTTAPWRRGPSGRAAGNIIALLSFLSLLRPFLVPLLLSGPPSFRPPPLPPPSLPPLAAVAILAQSPWARPCSARGQQADADLHRGSAAWATPAVGRANAPQLGASSERDVQAHS